MKRFLSSLLAIMFVLSLSACDNSGKAESDSSETESSYLSSSSDSGLSDDDIIARVLAEHPDAEIETTADGHVFLSYYDGDDYILVTILPSGSVQTMNYGPDFYRKNFPSYEEVQAEYPEKTVLVWAIDKSPSERSAPMHTRRVNEYLDERGCEFALCLKPVKHYEYSAAMYPDQMLTDIKQRLDAGEQIDIISPMNYDEFVFDGLYEPLDEYLETDIGRELYRALPEKLWESLRINSGIYGISGDMDIALSLDRGYYVNAELAEKYGFDVTKPILEQLDILKAVKENEKNTDVFSAYANIENIVSFVNVKSLSSAVYWNNVTHSAELSIDNPQYIKWLQLFDTLKREGLLNNLSNNNYKDSFFIMSDTVCGGGIGYADMKPVEVNYSGNSVTAIPVFAPQSSIRTAVWATGICTGSEHKDEAFKLLAMIFTDPVLNNLLIYGIEGENYTLENGIVKEIEIHDGFNINPGNVSRFANQIICHRSEESLFTPEQYVEIFEKAEVYGDHDFALDPKNILNELSMEYYAADKLALPKNNESLDDVLAEYREGLYAAGVQKIIDECNKQYEEYKEEKDEKVF